MVYGPRLLCCSAESEEVFVHRSEQYKKSADLYWCIKQTDLPVK